MLTTKSGAKGKKTNRKKSAVVKVKKAVKSKVKKAVKSTARKSASYDKALKKLTPRERFFKRAGIKKKL
jgi:hypothetical protein